MTTLYSSRRRPCPLYTASIAHSLEDSVRHLHVSNDHPRPERPEPDHPKETKKPLSRDIVCYVQSSADSEYFAHPMDDHLACILHTKLAAEADALIVQPHCNIRLTLEYNVHLTGALKLRYIHPHTRNTNKIRCLHWVLRKDK
jgi:hypothetical protein